jgi:1-deoxy-D-xylulose-5-phosphate synthase
LVTIEENTEMGGFGSGVCELLSDLGITAPVLRLAIADCFVTHGAMSRLLSDVGLTPDGVTAAVLGRLSDLEAGRESGDGTVTEAIRDGAQAHRRHSG